MKLDVPLGTTFYWNPYSPKYYTIIASGSSSFSGASSCSDEEGSINPMDDDEYDLGWATIAAVRTETTDSAILSAIQRLPLRTLNAMLSVLEHSPSLLAELCEKERGNVVSHVMSVLGSEACHEIVRYVIDNAVQLATNQSGCIAFTRIYDEATIDQKRAICTATIVHFEDLVMHQYGNFVLSRLATGADLDVLTYMAGYFENFELLHRCVDNKFGSHVYESFIKSAPSKLIFRVASVLLADNETTTRVATAKVANYPLQHTLKQMLAFDPTHELSRWAVETLPALVEGTQYGININRALGFRNTNTAAKTNSSKALKA